VRAARAITETLASPPPNDARRPPVPNDAVEDLAGLVRAAGADELADRLERAVTEDVKLLALTLDERAILLAALQDPPPGVAELRAVSLNDHQWRLREGLAP
jgi:hypothetical protein